MPSRTDVLMSGCLISDWFECTVIFSAPLVLASTSAANCAMLRVWKLPSG
jgi:hypothetical protein